MIRGERNAGATKMETQIERRQSKGAAEGAEEKRREGETTGSRHR